MDQAVVVVMVLLAADLVQQVKVMLVATDLVKVDTQTFRLVVAVVPLPQEQAVVNQALEDLVETDQVHILHGVLLQALAKT